MDFVVYDEYWGAVDTGADKLMNTSPYDLNRRPSKEQILLDTIRLLRERIVALEQKVEILDWRTMSMVRLGGGRLG